MALSFTTSLISFSLLLRMEAGSNGHFSNSVAGSVAAVAAHGSSCNRKQRQPAWVAAAIASSTSSGNNIVHLQQLLLHSAAGNRQQHQPLLPLSSTSNSEVTFPLLTPLFWSKSKLGCLIVWILMLKLRMRLDQIGFGSRIKSEFAVGVCRGDC